MKFSTAAVLIQLIPSVWCFTANSCRSNRFLPSVKAESSSKDMYKPLASKLSMSTESESKSPLSNFSEADQNRTYIEGLLQNLSAILDRWIVTGSNGMVRSNIPIYLC